MFHSYAFKSGLNLLVYTNFTFSAKESLGVVSENHCSSDPGGIVGRRYNKK